MRLHRLRLENVRGVTQREVDFPDRGVIVLDGPNEIGKTSLLEALDLLLEEKDTSTKARIRAIQPVGADVGSVVEAEFSAGGHRLVYRKQFNRATATTLRVIEPVAEQLTGVAAHERVQAILARSMDAGLFKAVRLLQTAPVGQADLSGSSALAAALDRAAGVAGDPDAADPLAQAAEVEYARYLTAQGRPREDYRRSIERLAQVEEEVAAAEAGLAALAQDADRLAERLEVRAGVEPDLERAVRDVEAARAARAELDQVRDQLGHALTASRVAGSALERAESDRRARRNLVADCEQREQALGRLAQAVAASDPALREQRDLLEQRNERAAVAERASAVAEDLADLARADADHLRTRDDWARLRDRRAALVVCDAALADARAARSVGVDAPQLRALTQADLALRRAQAQLVGSAAELRVEPAPGVQVLLDGRPVAADTLLPVTVEVTLEVPGAVVARIRPGRKAAELAADVQARQAELDAALTAAGVADLEAAVAGHEEYRRAEQAEAEAGRERERLTRGRTDAQLAAEQDRLAAVVADYRRDRFQAPALPDDSGAADVARRVADGQATRLRAAAGAARAERDAAAADLRAAELTHARAETRLATATAELHGRREQLAADRVVHDDAAVEAAVVEAARALTQATVTERELDAQLPPEAVTAARRRTEDAERAHRDLTHRLATVVGEITALAARIDVAGDQGRQEHLDDARTAYEAARREHAELDRQARAAQLLHEVLGRHRAAARERYVAPFREQLRRLGRIVYGPGFDVAVDPDLRIATRTLDGLTVGHDQLSSGAQEQLAVLVRLACAAVVDPVDSVPLFFDDALGHSDPARLAALAGAFAAVAASTQVIVLTSSPDRFAGVEGAHLIRLGPAPAATSAPAAAAASAPAAAPTPIGSPAVRRVRVVPPAVPALFDAPVFDNATFDAAVFEGPAPRPARPDPSPPVERRTSRRAR